MKKNLFILLVPVLALLSSNAYSAERIQNFSVKDALQRGYDEGVIDRSIPVYFKGQSRPHYSKSLGEYKTNKKTNAFGKSDEKACQWAFLSAIKVLKQRAKKEGGKAVINIVSNYKNTPYRSATKYQCGAGSFVAGVAPKGTVVK